MNKPKFKYSVGRTTEVYRLIGVRAWSGYLNEWLIEFGLFWWIFTIEKTDDHLPF